MSRAKRAFRILGPIILMLCLFGAAATTAQAEEGASWKIEGKDASLLSAAISIKEIESHDATLATTIGGKKIEVLCTGAQPVGIKLGANGSITSGSQLRFSGCLTKINGVASGPCEPNSGGKEPGAILSKALKGLLIANAGSGLVRLEPTEGETLVAIETGELCSIGEKISLLGKLTLKDPSLETETETHLVVEGALTELWANSKTEEHKATITGSTIVQLAGTHAGKKWGGFTPKPVAGTWKLKGSAVTKELSPEVAIKEIETRKATLLSKISGTKLEVSCEEAQPIGIKIEPEGIVKSGSQVKLLGCVTKLNEKISGPCEPSNGGKEPGVITTSALKGLLIEYEKTGLIRLEPKEGETIAVIETGSECSVGEKLTVIGKIGLKEASLHTEAETHLLIEGPLTELWVNSKTEEHKATLDGSGVARLAGIHSGLAWSGTVPGEKKEEEKKEAKAEWLVNGAKISEALLPTLQSALQNAKATLLAEQSKQKIELLCTGMELIGAHLSTPANLSGSSKFTGCIFKRAEKTLPECEPHEGTEKGVIKTTTVKGLITLNESKTEGLIKLEPESGTKFATFLASELCPYGETVSIGGTIVLKDNEAGFGTNLVKHAFELDTSSHLWIINDTTEHKALVDGVALVSLAGAHTAFTWSGMPE